MALTLPCLFPSTFSQFRSTQLKPTPIAPLSPKTSRRINNPLIRSICCVDKPSFENDNTTKDIITRRSGNYSPTIWHFDYVQSLGSNYGGEKYINRVNKLKEESRLMLEKEMNPLAQLELIDTLQRLGLSYHFEDEIENLLKAIHMNISNSCHGAWKKDNLHATALEFRLLRQHGYYVNRDVFNPFKDKTGGFKAGLSHDTMGLLSLYEASFHLMKNESFLEAAREFTTKHLEEYVKRNEQRQDYVSILVRHALEIPLHWRLPRLEAVWFVKDAYERSPGMNPTLLELAKLDFNVVQSTHQEDLKHASRWWNDTGFSEKLPFARDRLIESFLWTLGMAFEPQFGFCRRVCTKVIALVATIDDIYDVYGTLDEVELFTSFVERWDVSAMDQLPNYMKICFFNLNNFVNEMAFDVLMQKGVLIIENLRKVWTDICKSFLKEAKWYYSGYTPTLQEYAENAYISISTPIVLMHAYISTTDPIANEALNCLEKHSSIIRQSALILRLTDDQGTSLDELTRGDVSKSIQCHMHETGASEDEARRHIDFLIEEAWKQLNEDQLIANSTIFSRRFIEISKNLARVGLWFYQHGDGFGGAQEGESENRFLPLLVNQIPIPLSDN